MSRKIIPLGIIIATIFFIIMASLFEKKPDIPSPPEKHIIINKVIRGDSIQHIDTLDADALGIISDTSYGVIDYNNEVKVVIDSVGMLKNTSEVYSHYNDDDREVYKRMGKDDKSYIDSMNVLIAQNLIEIRKNNVLLKHWREVIDLKDKAIDCARKQEYKEADRYFKKSERLKHKYHLNEH